jgi:ATP/ADP translocase
MALNSEAKILPFVKGFLFMSAAALLSLPHDKGSQKLFYLTIGFFVLFFGDFVFIIYPNLNIFHISLGKFAN